MVTLGCPKCWEVMDVYGLDDDILEFLPKPCAAGILLYPITQISESKENFLGTPIEKSENMVFFKQQVSNACGTIALLHAIGNNTDKIPLPAESLLGHIFSDKSHQCSEPIEKKLENIHTEISKEGQTAVNVEDIKTNLHFVVLCEVDGQIIEFDGRKDGPVSHGPVSGRGLLNDAATVTKKFMKRDANELNFSLMALCRSDSQEIA
ncbi:Ubiquitin carboxyl-terminal hydrolase isozyme L3 [Cichlidogyrus casuarinus]|uniref:Ubiquitin carboxyl-terminal hydrolase n=1 Tax=Cichlidogyrus casuarinus TaxID=1844966 RepID=A0ABD2QPR0_9PLAT